MNNDNGDKVFINVLSNKRVPLSPFFTRPAMPKVQLKKTYINPARGLTETQALIKIVTKLQEKIVRLERRIRKLEKDNLYECS